MKKYILMLMVMILLGWGCANPDGSGTVGLDGPILESVDRDGNLEFNGAVINSGDTAVSSVYVVIVLKDEDGNILEANSVSIFEEGSGDLLFPSERVFFSVTLESDSSRVFSKEVEVYYEDEADLPPPS